MEPDCLLPAAYCLLVSSSGEPFLRHDWVLRDQIIELKRLLVAEDPVVPKEWLARR